MGFLGNRYFQKNRFSGYGGVVFLRRHSVKIQYFYGELWYNNDSYCYSNCVSNYGIITAKL